MSLKSKSLFFSFLILASCSPTPGPDKAVAGAVLGAGWGAGAGAVMGNQVGSMGPGSAVGAGFGAVSGAISGGALDIAEGGELEQQRQLDSLKLQTAANQRALLGLQKTLDDRGQQINSAAFSEQVFFDETRASLRLGSAAQLEKLAEAIKQNPFVTTVEVHGHASDFADNTKNTELREARARTVVTFLSSHGVSLEQIKIVPHGGVNPLATNLTSTGKQLNRRVEVFIKP